MLYEDCRLVYKLFPIFILFISIWASVCMLLSGNGFLALLIFLVGATPFGKFVVCETKRENCKKYGKCIPGHITMAYQFNIDRYSLLISFFDDREKLLVTELYTRNPNYILKDCNCNVYKWKGTYVEDDFNSCGDDDMGQILQIPICDEALPSREIGKAKEV